MYLLSFGNSFPKQGISGDVSALRFIFSTWHICNTLPLNATARQLLLVALVILLTHFITINYQNLLTLKIRDFWFRDYNSI